jgi:hypothetical protein
MSQLPSKSSNGIKATGNAGGPGGVISGGPLSGGQVPPTAQPASVPSAQAQTAQQAVQAKAETAVADLRPGRFYKGSKSVYYVVGTRKSSPSEIEVHTWRWVNGAKDWVESVKPYPSDYVWSVAEIPSSVSGQLPPCPGLNQSVTPRQTRSAVNVIAENKNSPTCKKCGGKNKKVALLVSETYYCPKCEA